MLILIYKIKLSIPVMHSSVAILKLAETNITGATIIFLKVLVEKKYALPLRVLIFFRFIL